MGKVLVFDLEADNLIRDATTIWCIVTKNVGTGEVMKYGPESRRRKMKMLISFSAGACISILGWWLGGADLTSRGAELGIVYLSSICTGVGGVLVYLTCQEDKE